MSKTIVCFGAGPAYKGGMSNYNTSLAKAFNAEESQKKKFFAKTEWYAQALKQMLFKQYSASPVECVTKFGTIVAASTTPPHIMISPSGKCPSVLHHRLPVVTRAISPCW